MNNKALEALKALEAKRDAARALAADIGLEFRREIKRSGQFNRVWDRVNECHVFVHKDIDESKISWSDSEALEQLNNDGLMFF